MKEKKFSFERFFKTLKYSFLLQIVLGGVIYLIWLMFNYNSSNRFPFVAYTIGIGGLMLTTAGCVGPGRYRKKYDILICTPSPGSSFSEEIFVSGFSLIEHSTQSANIIVNDQKIGILNFYEGIGKTTIPREVVLEQTINSIWLQADKLISNKSYFTFFDYTENLSDDEIEAFNHNEESEAEFNVSKARVSYSDQRKTHTGSVALGLMTAAAIIMMIGAIYEILMFN